VARNPALMAASGLLVVLPALGCLPFFVGLVVVMPMPGHATWHPYRRAIGG
jgi:uncharacterized membrane protein